MRWLVAALFLALSAGAAHSQVADTLAVENEVEDLLEGAEDELADPEELADLLASLRDNPLDVNTASANDFASIPLLSPLDTPPFADYRTTLARFQAIPELQQVDANDGDRVFSL